MQFRRCNCYNTFEDPAILCLHSCKLTIFFINILIPRSNFIMMNIGHAGLGAGFFAVCVGSPVDVVRFPLVLS